ncbi:hypothetical protein [Streptomyces sp. NBC_01187]|uniref:hypothetical protein n=1 Tax=Streptomyces sp. NBC_01187 TaxID=2903766 RepID=UPI00386C7C01|nr:hypothetical protein OG220_16570 [Streptomyces sp. NBC_01187]
MSMLVIKHEHARDQGGLPGRRGEPRRGLVRFYPDNPELWKRVPGEYVTTVFVDLREELTGAAGAAKRGEGAVARGRQ